VVSTEEPETPGDGVGATSLAPACVSGAAPEAGESFGERPEPTNNKYFI
jgi:hypothetical protein